MFPDNSTTGKVEDVGHYTQVIWRATSEVGCAEATSADEDILVCRYTEAGNIKANGLSRTALPHADGFSTLTILAPEAVEQQCR